MSAGDGVGSRPWLAATPAAAAVPSPRHRHAWVRLQPGTDPVPALILRWSRAGRGWAAIVVVADEQDQGILVQVPAEQIRPAGDHA